LATAGVLITLIKFPRALVCVGTGGFQAYGHIGW
jgi:hypothetical protein